MEKRSGIFGLVVIVTIFAIGRWSVETLSRRAKRFPVSTDALAGQNHVDCTPYDTGAGEGAVSRFIKAGGVSRSLINNARMVDGICVDLKRRPQMWQSAIEIDLRVLPFVTREQTCDREDAQVTFVASRVELLLLIAAYPNVPEPNDPLIIVPMKRFCGKDASDGEEVYYLGNDSQGKRVIGEGIFSILCKRAGDCGILMYRSEGR